MSSPKPVVIYGVTGYTGRLVAEFLREYHMPFIAAGRDAKRIQEVLDKVPGIETAEYDVVEVPHTVEALRGLVRGAKVLCNMVGPFMKYGPEAVEACFEEGVHYTDTNGEQNWMMWCEEHYGEKYAGKNLLLSPGIAQMYTTGEIAMEGGSIAEGIGQVRITKNLEGFTPDFSYNVSDKEALPVVFDLLAHEGLCLGASSGVNVAGAMRLARDLGPGHTIVTILCDFGTRYHSKLFNPEFLRENELQTLSGDPSKLQACIGEVDFPPLQQTLQWMLGLEEK